MSPLLIAGIVVAVVVVYVAVVAFAIALCKAAARGDER